MVESPKEQLVRSANWLLDCSIATDDGKDGKLADLLFDENNWEVQYLHVRTGSWLHGREALVSVGAVRAVQDEEQLLHLTASGKGIHESPELDTTLPISQEAELLLAKYWQWATPASGALPPEISGNIAAEASDEGKEMSERATESRLRSVKEVEGYAVSASDGELGHLEDLLCDQDWRIRYAVVDTRNWLPGKHVLLLIDCIESVRWSDEALHVWPTREHIREAPEYDPGQTVSKADADALQKHYARDAARTSR